MGVVALGGLLLSGCSKSSEEVMLCGGGSRSKKDGGVNPPPAARGSLEEIVYRDLGLPFSEDGTKLSADYNDLTRKLDGNIGPKAKNGLIATPELFEEVFSDRNKYTSTIEALRAAGLEDPFEATPEAENHVLHLFKTYRPRTEKEKAILIYRSVMKVAVGWRKFFGVSRYYFRDGFSAYYGLPVDEGGLDIGFNKEDSHPLRRKYGSLLPAELIAAQPEQRAANCLEYSYLLAVFLRLACIDADLKDVPGKDKESGHTYVLAMLDGQRYLLDIAGAYRFEPSDEVPDSERWGVVMHYMNECMHLLNTDRRNEALACYEVLTTLEETEFGFWMNKGLLQDDKGDLAGALASFNRVIELKPDHAKAWDSKGLVLAKQGNIDGALRCFKKALALGKSESDKWKEMVRGYYSEVLVTKGIEVGRQGALQEALGYFDKAFGLDPENADAIYNKGVALDRLGRFAEAQECFRQYARLSAKKKR